MASIVPAMPLLARDLQADFATVQFVISAYLLGLAVFQPLQGLLCDRFGRRPVLLGGFALFLVASLLASAATQLLTLVLARFLQAMGVSVATVVTRAIVRDSFEPGPAATALSFITAVMGVAPVVAPFVGGLASDAFGWRGIFWLHASVALCLLALLATQLRETRPSGTEAMTLGDLVRGARLLLRQRGFLGHSLTYSAVSAAGFMFITIGADLYTRLFDMKGSEFGAFWSGLAISYVIGALSAGYLSRRLDRRRTLRFGLACNALATLLFALAALSVPNFTLFSSALGLLMMASGIVSPLALAGAVDDHPELAGVASGLSSSIAMLLSMFSAIATGLLYDGTARPSALLMGIVCVFAWLAASMARSGRPQPPGQ